jgi:hypothetical protein
LEFRYNTGISTKYRASDAVFSGGHAQYCFILCAYSRRLACWGAGFNVETLNTDVGQVNVWDVGGQEKVRLLSRQDLFLSYAPRLACSFFRCCCSVCAVPHPLLPAVQIRPLWRHYYDNTSVVAFTIDPTRDKDGIRASLCFLFV